jgi:hypothetical protein
MADETSTVQNPSQPAAVGDSAAKATDATKATDSAALAKASAASEPAKAPEQKADAKPDAKAAPDPKTVETKADEAKPDAKADEKPAAPVVPEKYELAAPEGHEFNPAFVDALTPAFKNAQLTNETAQALVNGYLEYEAHQRTAQIDAWKSEVAADPKLGGLNAVKTTANIDRVTSWYSKVDAGESKSLQSILKASGLGEHPAFVRFINAIGVAMADDDTAGDALPTGSKANGAAKRSAAETLYGT